MSASRDSLPATGVVVIGRNEGARLVRCLASLAPLRLPLVYVDSGSSDGSVAHARSAGAAVVELDPARPFTAARARNEGVERLLAEHPDLALVQLVDGDCELVPGWLERANEALRADPTLAVVCGRRRERFPAASLYNRLCDLEWDTPVGEALACGGDALVRVDAFRAVGGFDPELIAGEEPELCLRLRERGWRILRLEAEMTLHDAAMTRATQWWKRALRTGHTAAVALDRRGIARDPAARRARSAVFWTGASLSALAMALTFELDGHARLAAATLALALLAWCALFLRVTRHRLRRGDALGDALLYAGSCCASKWPEVCGALAYVCERRGARETRWIEYKDLPPAAEGASEAAPAAHASRAAQAPNAPGGGR